MAEIAKSMTRLYPWLRLHYDKITAAFSQGHGHHALLFKTDSGLGAEQLIHEIAAFLFCQEADKPCGHCHHCHLFAAGSHPDFHLLAPIENKDIGIDQVREVSEKVNQHAQQNGNKVVYIQRAERLTENAANALLKTLEEPRPNTYFLLQADLSAPLMATIYSRCQTWLIQIPPAEQALAWLQQQQNEKTQDFDTALRVSHGRPLFALQMLEQGLLEKRREFLRHFWLFYSRRSPLELLPHFDKDIVLQQLDWISDFLTDALKDKLNIQSGWVSQDLVRGIKLFNQRQTAQGLLKANEIIDRIRRDLSQINGVNQELILLDGLTRLITEVFDN